jgi:hypothetical protein
MAPAAVSDRSAELEECWAGPAHAGLDEKALAHLEFFGCEEEVVFFVIVVVHWILGGQGDVSP